MDSLERFARGKLDDLAAQSLKRTLAETDRYGPTEARRNGRDVISFCCNDYLNLSHHPRVIDAAIEATRRFGAGSGASRLVTGNHPLFADLEARLARYKEAEDAVVFGSGYLTNIGIIPSLIRPDDLIVADEYCHACLFAGSQISHAKLLIFRHNDLAHCAELLARAPPGPSALPDPHRRGVQHGWRPGPGHRIGRPGGRARCLADDRRCARPRRDRRRQGQQLRHRQKGACAAADGHAVEGGGRLWRLSLRQQTVIDLIKTRARSFIYTTGLPPGSVAACIAALELIENHPELVAKPMQKARRFTRALNLPDPESCIVPLILGDPDIALAASQDLIERGFLVTAIRPPTVPPGTARLRFTFTAEHRDADIDRLVEAVRPHMPRPQDGAA